MKTSEIITLIISSIGGSAALFAVVAWLARSLIKHFLEKDLESFKLNLEKFHLSIRYGLVNFTKLELKL